MAHTSVIRVAAGTYDGGLVGWEGVIHSAAPKKGGKVSADAAEDDGLQFNVKYAFGASEHTVRTLAMDTDSAKLLVEGGDDETLRLYNLDKCKAVGALMEHTGTITCLEFVGKTHLLSGGEDGSVCIWRTKDWVCAHKLNGHKAGITSVSIHPSQRLALSASKDRSVRMWDLIKGKQAFKLTLPQVPQSIMWAADGVHYGIVFDRSIRIVNLETGDAVDIEHPVQVHGIAFVAGSKNVTRVASGGEDTNVRVWCLEGKLLATIPSPHTPRVRCIRAGQFSGLMTIPVVCTTDSNGKLAMWLSEQLADATATSLPAPILQASVGKGQRITSLAVSACGNSTGDGKQEEDEESDDDDENEENEDEEQDEDEDEDEDEEQGEDEDEDEDDEPAPAPPAKAPRASTQQTSRGSTKGSKAPAAAAASAPAPAQQAATPDASSNKRKRAAAEAQAQAQAAAANSRAGAQGRVAIAQAKAATAHALPEASADAPRGKATKKPAPATRR